MIPFAMSGQDKGSKAVTCVHICLQEV